MIYILAITLAYIMLSLFLLMILWGIDSVLSVAKIREAFSWPWTVVSVCIEEWKVKR